MDYTFPDGLENMSEAHPWKELFEEEVAIVPSGSSREESSWNKSSEVKPVAEIVGEGGTAPDALQGATREALNAADFFFEAFVEAESYLTTNLRSSGQKSSIKKLWLPRGRIQR